MRNIKLTIEYDGSRYQGWTRLGKDESGNTISNKITEVLKKMTEEDDLELFCGCRTEVGVHAYAQIANFRTSCSVSTQNIKHYLNRMTIDDVPSVFDRKYTYHCYRIPDKRMMQQAAEKLTGRHDFRNFSSAKKTKSTVREIFDIDIYGDIEEMQILIHADDFLHNMARIIVGTLMDIGLGNRSVQDIDDIFAGILEASAPCDPKGLYLQEVTY